jgi:hypothetical protein
MTREHAANASGRPAVWVDTFRKGLLAALGHDLRLSVERFEIVLDHGELNANLDLASLRVVGAMSHGRLDAAAPRAPDREEIQRAIEGILETARYPKATLTGTVTARGPTSFVLAGELRLHGVSLPISLTVSGEAQLLRAHIELTPSRFGIAPYRALGGALKLQDRVAITVELPLPSMTADSAEPAGLATTSASWCRP